MNRRRLLGSLASAATVGAAGCASARSVPGISDDPEPVRSLSVENVDGGRGDGGRGDDAGLVFDVTLVRHRLTRSRPPKLRIEATNTGAPRRFSVTCGLFERGDRTSDEARGLSLTRGDVSPSDSADGPFSREEHELLLGGRWDPGHLSSGESVTHEYEIWDYAPVEGYYEPGVYRWEHVSSVDDEDGEVDGEDSDRTEHALWGFSLRVEEA